MSANRKFLVVLLLLTSLLFGGLYFDTDAELQSQIAECEKHEETISYLRKLNADKYHDGFEAGYNSGYNDASDGENSMYGSYSSSDDDSSYDDSDYTTVYITETGSKYHQSWCSYLRESSIAVSLSDALAWGYDDCSRCW